MDAFLNKASSAINQATETTATSLKTARDTLDATIETARTQASSAVNHAKTEASVAVNQAKTEASSATQKLTGVLLPQVKDAVDGTVAKGIGGAKSLFHSELSVSADNQPGQPAMQSKPWWENCCGVFDLLKASAR